MNKLKYIILLFLFCFVNYTKADFCGYNNNNIIIMSGSTLQSYNIGHVRLPNSTFGVKLQQSNDLNTASNTSCSTNVTYSNSISNTFQYDNGGNYGFLGKLYNSTQNCIQWTNTSNALLGGFASLDQQCNFTSSLTPRYTIDSVINTYQVDVSTTNSGLGFASIYYSKYKNIYVYSNLGNSIKIYNITNGISNELGTINNFSGYNISTFIGTISAYKDSFVSYDFINNISYNNYYGFIWYLGSGNTPKTGLIKYYNGSYYLLFYNSFYRSIKDIQGTPLYIKKVSNISDINKFKQNKGGAIEVRYNYPSGTTIQIRYTYGTSNGTNNDIYSSDNLSRTFYTLTLIDDSINNVGNVGNSDSTNINKIDLGISDDDLIGGLYDNWGKECETTELTTNTLLTGFDSHDISYSNGKYLFPYAGLNIVSNQFTGTIIDKINFNVSWKLSGLNSIININQIYKGESIPAKLDKYQYGVMDSSFNIIATIDVICNGSYQISFKDYGIPVELPALYENAELFKKYGKARYDGINLNYVNGYIFKYSGYNNSNFDKYLYISFVGHTDAEASENTYIEKLKAKAQGINGANYDNDNYFVNCDSNNDGEIGIIESIGCIFSTIGKAFKGGQKNAENTIQGINKLSTLSGGYTDIASILYTSKNTTNGVGILFGQNVTINLNDDTMGTAFIYRYILGGIGAMVLILIIYLFLSSRKNDGD